MASLRFLLCGKYRMEKLLDAQEAGGESDGTTMVGSHAEGLVNACEQLEDLGSILFTIVENLSDEQIEIIEESLDNSQKALITWLATAGKQGDPDLALREFGLAQSTSLWELLSRLDLVRHAAAVSMWCEDQGAASLTELLENREDLVTALEDLTPPERARLRGASVDDDTELAVVRARFRALGSVLHVMMRYLSPEQLESADSNLSTKQRVLIASMEPSQFEPVHLGLTSPPATPAEVEVTRSREPLVQSGSSHAPPILLSPQSRRPHGPITSAAVHVSKRDAELLRSVLSSTNIGSPSKGQNNSKCQGCGTNANTGWVCRDDGCLYCKLAGRSGRQTRKMKILAVPGPSHTVQMRDGADAASVEGCLAR